MFKKTLIALLDHFEGYVCQVLLTFFVTLLFIQIIFRIFGLPLTWSEEMARYSFLWFIMFGACYATRLAALNRVVMHLTKMPKPVANTLLILGDLFWVIFSLAMAWYGYLSVRELIELPYYTPALDWNLSYVYLIFPFCFLLMAIRIIQVNICRYILKMEIIDPDKASVEESKSALMAEPQEDSWEEAIAQTKCTKEERP